MTALHEHLKKALDKRAAAEARHLQELPGRRATAATRRQLDANAAKPATMPGRPTGPNPPKG